jgi:hypothetical protein
MDHLVVVRLDTGGEVTRSPVSAEFSRRIEDRFSGVAPCPSDFATSVRIVVTEGIEKEVLAGKSLEIWYPRRGTLPKDEVGRILHFTLTQ